MSDERAMIDSEAVTAGAIRQSVEAGERCPFCNSGQKRFEPDWGKEAHSFSCGTIFRGNGEVSLRWGDCQVRETRWLRRQLAQALAREAQLRRVVEAARHDYNSARTACDYRRGGGGCEAWIKRGRTCPDCPLESFDALSGALAAIDGDTIATCANGTRLEALGGGAGSGMTKHTSDDPTPPHRTHTDAPGVSEGGGLDPGSQGAANRTAGEGSDSA